jgi:hypothetical protein
MHATLQCPTSSPTLTALRTEAKTGWLVATREQDPRDSRFIKTTRIIYYHTALNAFQILVGVMGTWYEGLGPFLLLKVSAEVSFQCLTNTETLTCSCQVGFHRTSILESLDLARQWETVCGIRACWAKRLASCAFLEGRKRESLVSSALTGGQKELAGTLPAFKKYQQREHDRNAKSTK